MLCPETRNISYQKVYSLYPKTLRELDKKYTGV